MRENRHRKPPKRQKQNKGRTEMGYPFRSLRQFLSDGFVLYYLPQILFVVLLGVFYIGSRHRSERMIREIEHLKVEVADLRAEYMGAQAAYMYASRRTEVLKRARQFGLVEPQEPPFILDVVVK